MAALHHVDLNKTVLNENLFGIDESGESIEISKLSLSSAR
jgi:hypothetical protein